ncbi:translation initiation factor [Oscillatoriales cyanobacterium LEGE 11467]|uniref:Translation initiation factor n=1 Tax=Zarconia navalis LEGE 11467 TaxID=1828826 RepID=A0A928W2D2_9CYAN|nr:translation initiation factor [Zarconia navalis]MBE9041940.1 translation initiation factor [Zarconia navalis LEGE 11467]
MPAKKRKSPTSKTDRKVYSEFGTPNNSEAIARPEIDLPPQQQQLRIQASRKERGGKTVTVIRGFQLKTDTLKKLLKQLKNQCGTGGSIKDETLEIQGDRTQQILEILTKLGYKAKVSGG